jgi:hypothetical protein
MTLSLILFGGFYECSQGVQVAHLDSLKTIIIMKKIARGLGAILVTLTATGKTQLVETGKIRLIASNGEGAVIITNDTRNFKMEVDESLQDIFDQQNTTGKNLGLIKVTVVGTNYTFPQPLIDGQELLIPTHTIHRIFPENDGEQSKIHLCTDGKAIGTYALTVSEELSDIMSQQGGALALGLLLVTRLVAKELPDKPSFDAIYNWGFIEKIVEDTTVGTANARIIFCGAEKDVYVEDTVANIFADQPE